MNGEANIQSFGLENSVFSLQSRSTRARTGSSGAGASEYSVLTSPSRPSTNRATYKNRRFCPVYVTPFQCKQFREPEAHRSGKYCVMFISKEYVAKSWTRHERRAALSRALTEREEYILPTRFDETEVPGIPPTVGYISLVGKSPGKFGKIILEKLRGAPRRPPEQ